MFFCSARLRSEEIWFGAMLVVSPDEETPSRRLWRDLYAIVGPVAMRTLFLSSTSACHAARSLFVEFCEREDGIVAGPYARFCCECVSLRTCSYLEVKFTYHVLASC